MPTINQLTCHGRKTKRRTQHTQALTQCPQKQGICLRVSTRTPKKPNLALGKIAKVRLTNRNEIITYIPGEGHNLQEHSVVMVRGGRTKDLPSVKYHCIWGIKGLQGISSRCRGWSKYGTEKPKDSIWIYLSNHWILALCLVHPLIGFTNQNFQKRQKWKKM